MFADVLPGLKTYNWILWVIFYVTLPLRLYTNWLALAALVIGIVKRHGIPKFNKEFLQKIIIDDNLQMLPYLGVVVVAGGTSLILYLPLVIHGYLQVAPLLKEILDRNPKALLISIDMIKKQILKGV